MAESAELLLFFQFLFVGLNVWGLTNGLQAHRILRKRRVKSPIIQALYEANLALCLNAATFLLLIAQAAVWPSVRDASAPLWAQIGGTIAFLGACFGLSYAQFKVRAMLTKDIVDEA
jgi:hypothetical protein